MVPHGQRRSVRARPGHGSIRALLLLVTATGLLALTPAAHAAEGAPGLDPELASLPFGRDARAISDWLGKRLDRLYKPRLSRAADANERARLREQRDRELGLVRADEQVFDGRQTGLESSIVASEFGVGSEESLLRYQEGEEIHYFFLWRGVLWKYARKLAPGASFIGRVTALQGPLGEPVALKDETDGEGGRMLVQATWEQPTFAYRLANRRTIYGADLLVMEHRQLAAELAKVRKPAQAPGKRGPDPSLEDFFLDNPDSSEAPPAADSASGPKP